MSGRIDFTMGFNAQGAARKKDEDNTGFRIYILGNFSGRSEVSWEQRKIRRIDIDHLDEAMAQIMPELEISTGLRLQFDAPDAFHPDVWLGKIKLLADLRELKRELINPNTASQAAAKIRAFYPSEIKSDTPVQPQEAAESDDDTLLRLLGKKPESTIKRTGVVDRLLDQIVSPLITRGPEPGHQDLIKVIDTTISQFLRTLLHSQEFQRLEALWRATEALVNEETSDEQSFFLVDISQAELLGEWRAGGRAFEQKLMQHVASGDGKQDVLLVGDYGFSDSEDDKSLLRFCSQLAKACAGCFLGAASPALIENSIFGASGKLKNWTQYLNEISADRVILAYPRYLVRLPYGNKRDPIEAFEFEECSAMPRSEELLWGNPAFLCARVLIKARNEDPFFFSDIPAFTFDQDGEPVLQSGVETLLNENQANALMAQGIMPLIGFRQRQGIRLLAVSTLAGNA